MSPQRPADAFTAALLDAGIAAARAHVDASAAVLVVNIGPIRSGTTLREVRATVSTSGGDATRSIVSGHSPHDPARINGVTVARRLSDAAGV